MGVFGVSCVVVEDFLFLGFLLLLFLVFRGVDREIMESVVVYVVRFVLIG